ncbi:MAG: hypothetical protein ABIZ83_17360, partial [Casimicrobium sp.]
MKKCITNARNITANGFTQRLIHRKVLQLPHGVYERRSLDSILPSIELIDWTPEQLKYDNTYHEGNEPKVKRSGAVQDGCWCDRPQEKHAHHV